MAQPNSTRSTARVLVPASWMSARAGNERRAMVSTARRAFNTAYLAALSARERRVPFWPAERIAALQRRRLRAMVRHAYATVPFYRRALDERGLRPEDFTSAEDLARLPLIAGRMV